MNNAKCTITSAALLATLTIVGCGPYAGIQADLVAQGREATRRVEEARRADAAAVLAFLAERRDRLDDAFDRDVRARPTLDPDWVIASRRAYAIGIDALADARARQDRADAAAADNAAAADEALALLEHMLRAQQNLWPTTRTGGNP
jgi:hypothetical protein